MYCFTYEGSLVIKATLVCMCACVYVCVYLTSPKSLQMVIAAMKLKDAYSLEEKL